MKLNFSIFLSLIFIAFIGCNRADPKNSRAYIEGEIAGSNVDFTKISVKIISDQVVVAETIPNVSGSFTLTGPLISNSYALALDKKIKSFSASKTGCKLSADSKQILIPEGITYLIFNEIILE